MVVVTHKVDVRVVVPEQDVHIFERAALYFGIGKDDDLLQY
jgi:hypothetical protein